VKNCISSSNRAGFEANSFQRDFIRETSGVTVNIDIYAVWQQAGTADHFFKDAAFALNGINLAGRSWSSRRCLQMLALLIH
jgi:hypothetical protein